ncbi:unnamed protein product [Rotaria magnacalcarata]
MKWIPKDMKWIPKDMKWIPKDMKWIPKDMKWIPKDMKWIPRILKFNFRLGSLDGTCKIHTVEHGIYVRILCPAGDPIVNLQLSSERHILIQIEKDDAYLFLYSINGDLIRTKKLQNKVVDMLLNDQHIILAVNHVSLPQSTNKKESTISVVTRIVIQHMLD